MSQTNAGPISMLAGEALAVGRRVRLHASTARTVVYTDADEECLGVTLAAAANGAPVAIQLNGAGTCKVCAKAAVAANADIYGHADGKVDDAGNASGSATIGKALEAALADGDLIECVLDGRFSS